MLRNVVNFRFEWILVKENNVTVSVWLVFPKSLNLLLQEACVGCFQLPSGKLT